MNFEILWTMKWKQKTAIAVATSGYVGYFPVAPGTVGSAVGAGLVWMIHRLPVGFFIFMLLLVTAAGFWSCYASRSHFRVADSPRIVIDEVAGMMLTMAFVHFSL